jgi:hypothetical protein
VLIRVIRKVAGSPVQLSRKEAGVQPKRDGDLPNSQSQLPGWTGSAATLVTQVGVPTVVAGVLLWFVLFRLDTTMNQIEVAEQERIKILMSMQDTLVAALERQSVSFEAAIQENIKANREMLQHRKGEQ